MLKGLERGYIEAAMKLTRGNVSQRGQMLGINRTNVYSRRNRRKSSSRAAAAGRDPMYLDHFGLKEPPFRITPDTDFFFQGANRGATLEALLYACTHDEGIVKDLRRGRQRQDDAGRVLMERLPATVETIYLANPSLSRDEILLQSATNSARTGKRTNDAHSSSPAGAPPSGSSARAAGW